MHKTPRKLTALLLVAMAALVALPAAAHPRHSDGRGSSHGYDGRGYDGRGYDGRGRPGDHVAWVQHGVRSGELTRAELRRIERERKRVRKLERRIFADGVVTRREQRRLAEARQDLARLIHSEKNDRQRRW